MTSWLNRKFLLVTSVLLFLMSCGGGSSGGSNLTNTLTNDGNEITDNVGGNTFSNDGSAAPNADPAGSNADGLADTRDGLTYVKLRGSEGDSFGWTVSMDGDRVFVGAPRDDRNGLKSGSVFVYELHGSKWVETANVLASDGAAYDLFGNSLFSDGNRLIVGAPGNGAAYVYELNGGVWVETTKLVASAAHENRTQFGNSVSLDGNRAIVGSSYENNKSGSVYIFELQDSLWKEAAKLTASDRTSWDNFGISVSLDGDRAIVGTAGEDRNGNELSGSAYVFEVSDGTWLEVAKLNASDSGHHYYFGQSVSLDGDQAIVGASGAENYRGEKSGATYVFTRINGTWAETAKLTASDGEANHFFGQSVSLDANRALIGAHRYGAPIDPLVLVSEKYEYYIDATTDIDQPVSSGAAYVYELSGGVWVEITKLTANDGTSWDSLGFSVSLDGDQAIVSAWGDKDPGGSAYLFTTIDGCNYDNAAFNGGWGWNPSIQNSCPP